MQRIDPRGGIGAGRREGAMKPLGELLRADLLARDGDRARARTLRQIWPSLAGPALAAHSRARLEKGTIVIACDDPAWADEVLALGDTLRPRLAAAIGAPVALRVETERRVASREATPPVAPAPEAPAAPPAAVVAAAASILDVELRRKVVETAARYLAAQRRRKT